MSHEDTLLAGELTDAQIDELVAAFVVDSDPVAIAHRLDLPKAMVLAALEDGTISARAAAAKRHGVAIRFLGGALDTLQGVLDSHGSMRDSTKDKLLAIKLMQELLGASGQQDVIAPAPKRGRPKRVKPQKAARLSIEDDLEG